MNLVLPFLDYTYKASNGIDFVFIDCQCMCKSGTARVFQLNLMPLYNALGKRLFSDPDIQVLANIFAWKSFEVSAYVFEKWNIRITWRNYIFAILPPCIRKKSDDSTAMAWYRKAIIWFKSCSLNFFFKLSWVDGTSPTSSTCHLPHTSRRPQFLPPNT